MVLVSKEVVISGTQNEHGEMTTIEGGIDPFGVDALGTPREAVDTTSISYV